ncbi:hypothetical protein ARAM_003843 [Aspergillus rambellii]|uniref:Zn(2)-C6 fungal-type domain-containing protein n=3 Tax=Aspergillus subgen. Nidulantes TaxID=2720870 RepID=A0A0F8V494_9EURO|nr:hypothetical protein ARAM_003843 [Aspergillus rambellii]
MSPASGNRRRRKPLACEACYKRKIKCEVEGSSGTCIQCMRRNITCKIASRKGKRDNLKRSRYVRSLEERLRKTESLLRAAGILNEETPDFNDISDDLDDYSEDDSNSGDEETPSPRNEPSKRSSGASESQDASVEPDLLISFTTPKYSPEANASPKSPERRRSGTDQAASSGLKSESKLDTNCYIGRSSPLSILTREGIEWIKSKSGDAKYLSILLSHSKFDSPWDHWRPDVFYDVFSSQVFKPLPPRAEVFSLLGDYFRTVNRIFPLYHEATFMELVEWQYTQQTCDDAARWASINIILSLAYEYRFSNSQKSEKDREKAWLYYKNALSVFPELVLRRTDLLSVQALLGMALFLRGNSGTQSTVPIVTAAIRSSHRMGLHRNIQRPGLSKVEQEQRRRIFWIAYIFDQSTCIRLGSAPIQQFDDFDVGLPSEETGEDVLMPDNRPFFPRLCHIALIKSRIYRKLYSARALENKSVTEICEIVHDLHKELEGWRGPSQFDTLLKKRGSGDDFLVGFASAGLFLVYYNSLIMIHRLPLLINFAYQSNLDKVTHSDALLILSESSSSAAVCVQAARDTLKLVNNLPWGDIAWIWSLLYYVFLAVMTIFVNILRNSQQPTAKDDLQSLNMAATFFATLAPGDGPCNYARFMTRMSATFERIARTVVERERKAFKPLPDAKHKPPKSRLPATTLSNGHISPRSSTNHTDNRPSQSASSPDDSATSFEIPNLDGLPPINSCGYVVRESPSDTHGDLPVSAPHPMNTTATRIAAGLDPSIASDTPQQQQQQQPGITNLDQFQQLPPNNPYALGNMTFPLSALEEANFQPDLWQIPLSADWELGAHFLGNVLGHPGGFGSGLAPGLGNANSTPPTGAGQSFFFQGNNYSQPVLGTTAPLATIPSIPIPGGSMGYGYGPPGRGNGSGNGNGNGNFQAPELHHTAMWMDANFGPPPF